MLDLISSREYTAAADKLRTTVQGAEEAIDAAEWDIQRGNDVERYPIAIPGQRLVRYCVTDPSELVPSVVVLFEAELFNGKDPKILLLDVKIAEPDEE